MITPTPNVTTPTFTVITPTYNRAHLIGRAIDSVLAQTYEDFEMIIIDDGSRDNTEEVVKSYGDPRIRYITHAHNQGGSAARNTGLRYARGQYIAFLDSDDEWLPEKLTRHWDVFRRDPDCRVVYSAVRDTYPDGSFKIRYVNGPEGYIFDQLIERNVVGSTSAFVIKRSCFDEIGGFDESLQSAQDYDMWVRLAMKYRFRKVPEPLYVYYRHEHRITTNMAAKCQGQIAIINKYGRYFRRASRGARGRRYYRLGNYLCHEGDVRTGRRYLIKAALARPWHGRCIVALVCSFFGPAVYKRVAMGKRAAEEAVSFRARRRDMVH